MSKTTPTWSFMSHGEAGRAQSPVEALIVVFSPDREHPAGLQGRADIFNRPAAVERILDLVSMMMRPLVEVKNNQHQTFWQHPVLAAVSRTRSATSPISTRTRGSLTAPLVNADSGPRHHSSTTGLSSATTTSAVCRQRIENSPESTPHPQTADQHPSARDGSSDVCSPAGRGPPRNGWPCCSSAPGHRR